MRSLFSVTLLLLLALTLTAEASKRAKHHKGVAVLHVLNEAGSAASGRQRGGRGAALWVQSSNLLSGDCKYKFGPWGNCDAATNTKTRSGTLKRALFNAECQATVKVSKPCSPKVKKVKGESPQ
ncbi:midkine b [Neolamprologus brichardi]|uniref:midkine b n=1 Tax=Neolamprologus brichardi TaxID=32507 RepID=UPI001643C155|nr:midkine b [Neolamprologus brichardi]